MFFFRIKIRPEVAYDILQTVDYDGLFHLNVLTNARDTFYFLTRLTAAEHTHTHTTHVSDVTAQISTNSQEKDNETLNIESESIKGFTS